MAKGRIVGKIKRKPKAFYYVDAEGNIRELTRKGRGKTKSKTKNKTKSKTRGRRGKSRGQK